MLSPVAFRVVQVAWVSSMALLAVSGMGFLVSPLLRRPPQRFFLVKDENASS